MNTMLDYAIDRFNLLDYVKERGAIEAQSNEWVLTCPTCRKEKLTVNIAKKSWHCWVCQKFQNVRTNMGVERQAIQGAGGLLDLIQMLEACDRKRAAQLVLASSAFTSKDLHFIKDSDLINPTVEGYQTPNGIPLPPHWKLIDSELEYMRYRGITMDDVNRLGIFYCDQGPYANRLVFPVWENGRLVYWQARAMWEQPGDKHFRKAMNPAWVPGAAVSSEVLMNLNTARFYPRVALVEGPIDCVHAGPDAVCSFTKALSAVQISKLYRAGVRAVDLMWDADARTDMELIAPLLSTLFDVRIVYLPEKDPGTYPRELLNHWRSQARSLEPTTKLMRI